MRSITILLLFIIVFSIYGLTIKERRELLEKDKKDLVDIIAEEKKINTGHEREINKLKNKIQELELKKAWLKGRLFGMGGIKAFIIIIVVFVVVAGIGIVIFKFVLKRP